MSVIDIATRAIVDTIPIGDHPDDVISTNAGDMLYLSIIKGHVESDNVEHIDDPGDVVAVDARTHEVRWRLPMPGAPHHPTLSTDDHYLFQPIFNTNFLAVVDLQERAIVARVPVGYGSHGTRISPDGARIYAGCMFSDRITVFDSRTFKIERDPLPERCARFQMTRDERRLFVQLSELHGFVEVDLATDRIVRTVDLPEIDLDISAMPWPHTVNHGLNITSDDRLLFAAGSAGDYCASTSCRS